MRQLYCIATEPKAELTEQDKNVLGALATRRYDWLTDVRLGELSNHVCSEKVDWTVGVNLEEAGALKTLESYLGDNSFFQKVAQRDPRLDFYVVRSTLVTPGLYNLADLKNETNQGS